MTIETMVAIIPQHKDIPRRDDDRPEFVSSIFCCEWFVLLHTVDKEFSPHYFNLVTLENQVSKKENTE
jgi:hypothetical protein